LFVQKRGVEKDSLFYRLLRWLDVQIARNCAALIVISERFRKTYISDRGIPECKITVIPNWIDDFEKVTTSTTVEIRREHQIPDDAFLVVYGGNIGVAAGVEQIVDAFQLLSSQENIYFLIAGSGSSLPNCVERIQKHKLERVKIHSPWNASDTIPILNAANLCILPTQGEQSLASVPSKLLTYMLAGRPVLAIASPQSETTRMIKASDAGWVISDTDPEAVAGCIHEISRISSQECSRRGQVARSFVLKHFSKDKNLSKVIELLFQYGKCSEQNSSYAI
jgi:glycosyltransferase involved in cell wall biosynthesis